MLSYGGYTSILISIYFVFFVFYSVLFISVPNGLCAKILRVTLSINARRMANGKGVYIGLGRIPIETIYRYQCVKWVLLLSSIYSAISIVFLNQCILATVVLGVDQPCLDGTQNCYVFRSTWTLSVSKSFVCSIAQPVVPASSSGVMAVCWGYILSAQTAANILNQLGISTGLIGLSAFTFWVLQHVARHPIRAIILIILSLAGLVGIVVLSFSGASYGLITCLIVVSLVFLTWITVWIMQGKNLPRVYLRIISVDFKDGRQRLFNYNVFRKRSWRGNAHARRHLPRHEPFYGSRIRRDLYHLSRY